MNHTKNSDEGLKRNWPNFIVGAFVIASIGVAGFIGWQGYQLAQKEQQLLVAIETQKQNLADLKEKEKIGEKMKAAEILNKAKKYRKNWSQVLKDLNETFTDRGAITFNNVAVDAANMVSVQAQAKDILTAASFLVLVKRSDKFENGFISSISPSGTGISGATQYQFNATFDYLMIQESNTEINTPSSDQ